MMVILHKLLAVFIILKLQTRFLMELCILYLFILLLVILLLLLLALLYPVKLYY